MHCAILNTITLRSDGKITCGESLGYDIELAEVPTVDGWKISDITSNEKFLHIRKSFERGEIPWVGTCEGCDVLAQGDAAIDKLDDSIILRVEPTLHCELSCPSCKRLRAARKRDAESWNLPPRTLESVIRACNADNVKIESVIFLGWGEPLDNPEFRKLVEVIRKFTPLTHIEVTSHGNVDYNKTLLGCKVDNLIVSVDGANQASYEKYRRNGKFASAIEFMRLAVKDGQRVTWKYIIFNHNDSGEEIAIAQKLAENLGVEHLLFVLTNSKGKSERIPTESIVDFPNKTKRSSISPAAALQRPVHVFQFRKLRGSKRIWRRPHAFLDRCFLANSGLLCLEGWVCNYKGDQPEKVIVEINGIGVCEIQPIHLRGDVSSQYDFPKSIKPGFIHWVSIDKKLMNFELDFVIYEKNRISKISFHCFVGGFEGEGLLGSEAKYLSRSKFDVKSKFDYLSRLLR